MSKRAQAILIGAIIIAFTMGCQPRTIIVKEYQDEHIIMSTTEAVMTKAADAVTEIPSSFNTPWGTAYPFGNGLHTCYIVDSAKHGPVPLGCVK